MPSADQLRSIADSVPTLVWSAASDGAAESFNQRWLDYTGLSASEGLGAGWQAAIIGGIAMGISMALLEETVADRTGRLATTSLAEYVVAVNADVRDVDVLFVGDPDPMTRLGTKGIGELAIAGMAAAIANAVYHATGTRIRSLPISIEKMLGHESASPRTRSSLEAIPAATASARHDGSAGPA